MKGQIHHIELWVPNLEKTLKFWRWILEYLGYQQYQKWDNGVSFKLGVTYIAFEQVDKENLSQYNRKKVGLNHLAFHLGSQSEIKNLVKLLNQKGIPLLYQVQEKYLYNGENKVIHIEDPDGFEIEFVANE